VTRPDLEALRLRLVNEGYQALKWTSEPRQAYIAHAHIYPELLWLVEGSLTIVLPENNRLIELTPGDRLEMPAGTMHGILAGPDGAVYLVGTRASTTGRA
jgi:quercetin dioxygenase-like cupin family protein